MLDIIFFSDAKSNTDYPSRLFKQISYEKVNIKFFKVSIITIIKVYKIIFFNILRNKNLIINTHHFKGAFSIFLIKNIFTLNKFKNIKWVHTFHAENNRFSGFKRVMNFIVYSKCDYLIGASDIVTLQWKSFLKKKNIKTINNGISKKEYSIIKNSPKKSNKRLKLLWVGRLENVKNPLMIIDALEKISSNNPVQIIPINIIAGSGVGIKEDTSEICISDFAKEVLYENLLDSIPEGFNLNLEIIFPNGVFLAERTSNKSFGIVDGLSIIGTSAETYSSASPDQLEEAKTKLAKLIQNNFKGKVVFVIGENGLNLASTHNVNLPIIKIGNWIGPLLVDAAIKKVKTVILFGYHGKLIKLAGGIFHTHNHLADARIEILVYLAVQQKVPLEIIVQLSQLNNLEDALLLLERFNKSLADKLFKNLSNTIEKRSFDYVNRYIKTDMEIASIMFDRKRKIRWAGINGKKYISYFQ